MRGGRIAAGVGVVGCVKPPGIVNSHGFTEQVNLNKLSMPAGGVGGIAAGFRVGGSRIGAYRIASHSDMSGIH